MAINLRGMPAPRRELVARGQLGELFFQIRDPVAIVSVDWTLEQLNPGGERLLGYSSDLLAGQPLSNLFADPLECRRCIREMTESLPPGAAGASVAVMARMRSRAGREFPARIKAFRVRGDAIEKMAVLVQEEPVGDLGDGDRALIRQVDQMAETARSIVGEVELGQVCQAFADLTKELVGADFSAVILGHAGAGGQFEFTNFAYNAPRHLFPERLPTAVGLLGLAIETGSVARLDDIRGHPAGVGIPVKHPPIAALLAVPLIHQGIVIGQLVAANRVGRPSFSQLDESIARHLGTLVVAGVEGARLQSALAQLESAKSDFLRLASHELRGPLTVLGGYCSMLADGSLGVELPGGLGRLLVTQVRQMEALVDQMLETTRLEDGRLQLKTEELHLEDLVAAVVEDFRARVGPAREIRLSTPGRSVTVVGDQFRLRAILSILIDNALKYSPGGEPVCCTLAAGDRRAVVQVADQGVGIEAADLPRLFQRFSRVSNHRTRDIPGTGLGLYLARHLARLHGGEVELVSRPGEGSSFTLRLPLAP